MIQASEIQALGFPEYVSIFPAILAFLLNLVPENAVI